MAKGHVHKEDGQGWYEWDREELAAATDENPKQYSRVRVVKKKLCECGEVVGTKIEYE